MESKTENIITFPSQEAVGNSCLSKSGKPIKVFEVDDGEWYFAPTMEEAIDKMLYYTWLEREEVFAEFTPKELTGEELDKLVFFWGDEDGAGDEHSFRVELKARVDAGETCDILATSNLDY